MATSPETEHQNALRDFSEKVLEYETTTDTKNACGRRYIRISKLKAWLQSKTTIHIHGYKDPWRTSQITRLLYAAYSENPPDQPKKEQLTEGENACLVVFSILLQLGQGKIIHLLKRNHKMADSHLPIDLFTLRTVFEKEKLPADLADRFNREQWKFCPAKFDLGRDMDFEEDHILPIYKKEKINNKGGTATVWQISVMEEFVGERLRKAVASARYEDLDCGPCYQLVLKVFEEGRKATFDDEKKAFSTLGNENGRLIRFLGEYSHKEIPSRREGEESPAGKRARTTYNILLELGECDLDELFGKNLPPVHPTEIEAFWRDLFEVAKAIKNVHNLKTNNDGMINEYWGWHADIKPDNILQVQGKFKLADPGFAQFVERVRAAGEEAAAAQPAPVHVGGGTTTYGAPEQYSYSFRLDGASPAVEQSIDTWSLGCVFSITATFVVLGYQGVRQYSKLRERAIRSIIETQSSQLNSGSVTKKLGHGDYFHDGFNVLVAVTNWHKYLCQCMRPTDKITDKVLALVDDRMLVDRKARSKTSTKNICEELDQILLTYSSEPKPELPTSIITFLEELDNDPEETTDGPSLTAVLESDSSQRNTVQDRQNRKVQLLQSHLIKTTHRSHIKMPASAHQTESESAHGPTRNSIQVPVPTISARHRELRGIPEADHSYVFSQRQERNRINTQLNAQMDIRSTHSARALTPPAGNSVYSAAVRNEPKPDARDVFQAREEMEMKKKKDKSLTLKLFFQGTKKDELLIRFYKDRDIIFLVDNAESMIPHWYKATYTLETLLMKAEGLDENGMDLWFTRSPVKVEKRNSKSEFLKAMKDPSAYPRSNVATDMSKPLSDLLESYKNRIQICRNASKDVRKLTIIILTDGIWGSGDPDSVTKVIVDQVTDLKGASLLNRDLTDRSLSIQFVQFGKDSDATFRLRRLDNGLKLAYQGIPDIVDTEHCDGDVNKMMLGSLDETYDKRDDDDAVSIAPSRNESGEIQSPQESTPGDSIYGPQQDRNGSLSPVSQLRYHSLQALEHTPPATGAGDGIQHFDGRPLSTDAYWPPAAAATQRAAAATQRAAAATQRIAARNGGERYSYG